MLLAVSAAGVLLVGVFPSRRERPGARDRGGRAPGRRRPRADRAGLRRAAALGDLGTALALLGLVGTAATVFFLTGVTEYLGVGGTERVAAYVIPVGLAVAGTRALAPRRARVRPTGGPSARRHGPSRPSGPASGTPPSRRPPGARPRPRPRTPDTADEDELDDHWAPVERRKK